MPCAPPRVTVAGIWGRCGARVQQGVASEDERRLVARFWLDARGYWRGRSATGAWLLTLALVAIVLLQLFAQLWFTVWNRDFFDAIGQRDGRTLAQLSLLFLPLAAANITLAIAAVWGRMTMQRRWRAWLSGTVLGVWMGEGRYARLSAIALEHDNPEYRIGEDLRVATDAPVDLVVGLLGAVLTAATFIGVLWTVGGDLAIETGRWSMTVPRYLVASALIYSAMVTLSMLLVGRDLIPVIERKNRTEAQFRAAAGHLRETGEGLAVSKDEAAEKRAVQAALGDVIGAWQALCGQLMRTTLVSQANTLMAPVVGLVLAAPKYLEGSLSLGEATQVAAAFVLVSGAFNWIVDNYQRLSDWLSSVNRVSRLLLALDAVAAPQAAVNGSVTDRFSAVSQATLAPGGTTSVDSRSSISAGPSTTTPGVSAERDQTGVSTNPRPGK